MTDLQDYISRAVDADKKERLWTQWRSAVVERTITCCCGQLRGIELAFRCLYCGEWYCVPCAEAHFGKTLHEHIIEKRVERRRELTVRYQELKPQ